MPIFILPNNAVKEIIEGKTDYNNLPFNEKNEKDKGYKFEDQANINLCLEKNHSAICSALEKECLRAKCSLFNEGKIGNLEYGWVCREYNVDFPNAPFDSRFHVALIGADKIDYQKSAQNLEDLKKKGGEHVCLKCNSVYAEKPIWHYEDGHGGRDLEMCPCGSDLFETIDGFINMLKNKK
jgi:hypothetical protein